MSGVYDILVVQITFNRHPNQVSSLLNDAILEIIINILLVEVFGGFLIEQMLFSNGLFESKILATFLPFQLFFFCSIFCVDKLDKFGSKRSFLKHTTLYSCFASFWYPKKTHLYPSP